MNTITQTLTLAQLREDLERLASAHPGSYPTNVIEVIHQCGEITVHAENDEDALREELKNAEENAADAEKRAVVSDERADKAEGEAETLRGMLAMLNDPSDEGETVLSYRDRTKAAEAQTDLCAAALLQAMASGATISTGVTEDVPSTVPVTRRLVVTKHGQHWEDIQ